MSEKKIKFCCKELRFEVTEGSFERESDRKIVTREGMQTLKFCPFCGKKLN